MTIKVLLDTDIGSDVDDAVCLAYLLAQPECELLGITTVTGEADKRAMLTSALCKAAGRDVPIYPGCEQPLLVPQKQPHAPQAAALSRWEHETEFPEGQAIEFMRHTIRKYPGELVLLTIGPLTNVALLFKMYPECASQLRALVMMCGAFADRIPGTGRLEWNARCDPHAAAIVYKTSVRVHRSIGLDVTRQVMMDVTQVRERFKVGLLQPVADFAEVWFKERSILTFHDPLAAVSIFNKQVCGFERGTIDVELMSEKMKGMTIWEPGGLDAPHEVALKVDSERFFCDYFSVF
jgi:inosine-uridine nucleoside N-ribohydrolase